MTRKDYERVAAEIRKSVQVSVGSSTLTLRGLVSGLSSAFMADNPKFDPDRFTKACGF